jgi:Domain of unknown function (DUF4160)
MRMHVHVVGEDGEAKFWIEPDIELAKNYGLGEHTVRVALRLIMEHEHEIRTAWSAHFKS